jgi:TatD DNase family protein
MLIDTHAHLDFPEFASDFDEVLSRAAAAGVDRIITIGTSIEGSRQAVELAERHKNVFATIGVHPNAARDAPEDAIAPLRELARSSRVVAIGEIGFDYHRLETAQRDPSSNLEALGGQAEVHFSVDDAATKNAQAAVFEQQLDLAVELGLNVVIHERHAWADTLDMLRPYAGKVRAVFHCFGKSVDHAREVLAMDHLVSFTGIVTFKNATVVQETGAHVPDGSFMVETDCPFLAPVPFRGKRCEPAHTRATAERLAQLRGTSLETIAEQTTRVASAFFRFP